MAGKGVAKRANPNLGMADFGPAPAGAAFAPIGVSGLRHFSGYVREEFLRELMGLRATRVYREMRDNDAIVGGVMFAIEMLLRKVEWEVKPPEDGGPDDEAAAEFVAECLDDLQLPFSNYIADCLSFLTYGFSLHEIVYKRRLGDAPARARERSKFDDRRIGWAGFPTRAQDTIQRWQFDDEGMTTGAWQQPPLGGTERLLPLEKCLLFRTTSHKDNPEGRSCLRNAYVAWYFKKRLSEIEAIGVERDLAGLPLMRIPAAIMDPNADATAQAQYAAAKNMVVNVRRDAQEGIILPSDRDEHGQARYDFELLTTGGTRQFDTDKIINRYDQRIAMTLLADFILLGHEKVGSFALSSDKTDLFAFALGAWLQEIGAQFNRHAVPRLLRLNGMAGQCELRHGDIEQLELDKFTAAVEALTGAGMPLFPDPVAENAARKRIGLPSLEESELTRPDPQKQADALAGIQPEPPPAARPNGGARPQPRP